MWKIGALGAVALCVAACDTPNTRFASLEFGDAKGLAAGGSLRLVTQRPRPLPDGARYAGRDWQVMCSEPSPDYLVTFDRSATGKAQGNFVANASTTFEGSVTSNEDAGTNATGRSEGVVALRDGLYAACQAYANGIIGQDAYSAILSQYGLLVAAVVGGPTTVVTNTTGPVTNVPAAGGRAASAFAAVLVACISAHDPSRPTPGRGNALLDKATCRDVIRTAGRGARG